MAYSQSDIEALKAAIAQGVTEFEYRSGDTTRRFRYRSLTEMQAILGQMQAEVMPASTLRSALVSYSRD